MKTYLFSPSPLFTLVFLLLFLTILPGCTPKSMRLSPITDQQSEYHPGQFVWCDLLTSDVDAARKFYLGLFDWTFAEQEDYTVILNRGVPIGGMVATEFKGKSNAYWISYLSVENVDQAAERVINNGGTITMGPGKMINRGTFAAISDPGGAALVLLRSDSGDPDTSNPQSGDWLWHELWTDDMETAKLFYSRLADYSITPVNETVQDGAVDNDQYHILSKDDTWSGGMTLLPFAKVPSQWVPAVRVDDLSEVISKVKELGGRIIVDPSHPLGNGTVALIEDPAGAILMIEAWKPEAEAKK